MAVGAGRYDDLCTYVREKAKAVGACVIIFGGEKGVGFSVQAPPIEMLRMAGALRKMADEMEEAVPADIKTVFRKQFPQNN